MKKIYNLNNPAHLAEMLDSGGETFRARWKEGKRRRIGKVRLEWNPNGYGFLVERFSGGVTPGGWDITRPDGKFILSLPARGRYL